MTAGGIIIIIEEGWLPIKSLFRGCNEQFKYEPKEMDAQ